MRRSTLSKKGIYTRTAVILASIVMLLALANFVYSQTKINEQNKLVVITSNYAHFEGHIQTFLMNNSYLMRGFSAYIQTFKNYSDEDVYAYLGHLAGEDMDYIRNIGIIKDTTIIWNFPKKGNEKALGTDLSKVPAQAGSIKRIKRTLKYEFDGPVNLVQGGTGYIMRIPIIKDGAYWGMVSVVLKADKVKALFAAYEKECNLKIAILSNNNANTLVYGDRRLLEQKPIVFHSTFTGGEWTIYAVAAGNTENGKMTFVWIIAIMGAMLILWVTYMTYRLLQVSEKMKSENETLNVAVMNDALTGIFNRKYFDKRIAEETDRVNRYHEHLSIIFFDLDHFKVVNDTYGHALGDAVLKEMALCVKQNLRASDIFARWGGEEFAILMPETTLRGAAATAEKLRRVVEAIDHNTVGRVTASFGVVEYIEDEFIGSWFHRVDHALYNAKSSGRNRVSIMESDTDDKTVLRKTQWTDKWLCGNDIIDTDHKQVLILGNEMIECSYQAVSKSELLDCVNHFARHIAQHFRNEKAVLESIGYPKLNAHVAEHERLIGKMEKLMEKTKNNQISAQELLHYLQNEMVLGHMLKMDMDFFPYIK